MQPEPIKKASSSFEKFLPAALFANRTAGRGRAAEALPKLRAFFDKHEIPLQFFETSSAAELEARSAEAISRGARALLALGGDGTAQTVAQAAYRKGVPLGIVPAGGGNDFAAALGIPLRPLEAARGLLNARTRRVDIALAKTADGRERVYLGGGGIGLDAEASGYAATRYRRWPGRIRYTLSALLAFRRFAAVRVEIESADRRPPVQNVRLHIANVLNTPTYGAGLRFAPDARVDDGLLNVGLLEELSVRRVLALLPRLLWRGSLESARVERFCTTRVRFVPDRACTFHGDGELFGPAPVEVRVLPEALSVLVPEPR